jgi:hypothetical protein
MKLVELSAVDLKDPKVITKQVRIIFGPGVFYHRMKSQEITVVSIIGGTIFVIESPDEIDTLLGMTPAKPRRSKR